MGCSRLKVIILRSKFEPKLGERVLLLGRCTHVEEHMEYANAGCGEELPVEGGERLTSY